MSVIVAALFRTAFSVHLDVGGLSAVVGGASRGSAGRVVNFGGPLFLCVSLLLRRRLSAGWDHTIWPLRTNVGGLSAGQFT